MPKMKTHRGAAKRLKVTGSGKIRRYHAGKSHLLGHKSARRKRHLRQPDIVSPADARRMKQVLSHG